MNVVRKPTEVLAELKNIFFNYGAAPKIPTDGLIVTPALRRIVIGLDEPNDTLFASVHKEWSGHELKLCESQQKDIRTNYGLTTNTYNIKVFPLPDRTNPDHRWLTPQILLKDINFSSEYGPNTVSIVFMLNSRLLNLITLWTSPLNQYCIVLSQNTNLKDGMVAHPSGIFTRPTRMIAGKEEGSIILSDHPDFLISYFGLGHAWHNIRKLRSIDCAKFKGPPHCPIHMRYNEDTKKYMTEDKANRWDTTLAFCHPRCLGFTQDTGYNIVTFDRNTAILQNGVAITCDIWKLITEDIDESITEIVLAFWERILLPDDLGPADKV
ncbi:hypothetical protein KDA11_05550 [Candidatus Saccharibacteria bacterium]|nr:hypothetical protein [Candidatus Saccharibacteria bacterium]